MSDKVQMRDGDAILVHVEFVRRKTGTLPDGAWVGTVLQTRWEVMGITSKYFFDYQLPQPRM
jgi:hypothetical protein